MKRILKNIGMILAICTTIILFNNIESQAALQSNPNTQNKKSLNNPNIWIQSVREMEMPNNALGFNEEINEDLTYKGESNGIDMHMMKNTEFGAVAILSASGYGNPNNDKLMDWTTGNKTGVCVTYGTGYLSEYVASFYGEKEGINKIYYDLYDDSSKIGDATQECAKWHGSSAGSWTSIHYPWFLRNFWSGYFSYRNNWTDSPSGVYGFCRGVAVCGEGL